MLLSRGPAEQGVAPEAVAEAYHAWEQGSPVAPLSAAAVSNQTIQESQRLLLLVRAYQVWQPLEASPVGEAFCQQPWAGIVVIRACFSHVHCTQVNGHFMANLDPLGLDKRPMPIELDPALYGFSDKDLDRE